MTTTAPTITKVDFENRNELLDKLYDGSAYTILGAGGDINEWVNGYTQLLNEEGIGTPTEFILLSGRDMNIKYDLYGDVAYNNDLIILAFPIEGLNIPKLAMFKLRMEDRWFDDVVDNNARHLLQKESATPV